MRDQYSLNVNDNAIVAAYNAALPAGQGNLALTPINQTFAANSYDSIKCTNTFYGGNLGLDVQSYFGQVFFEGRAKVALGAMRQGVDIYSISYSPTLNSGGILFNPGDVGNKKRTQISAIPELDLKIGYQFNHYCRVYVGYDGFVVYNVLRPANQIQAGNTVQVTVAGTTNTTNIAQDSFRFMSSNLYIQGINFGVEFRW